MRAPLVAACVATCVLAACAAQEAKSPSNATPAGLPNMQYQAPEPVAAARARAKSELEAAEIELGQAGSDCSRACKALASMERATDHLCGVVSTPDEQKQCDDAREKLKSSRDRVRSTCGECSH